MLLAAGLARRPQALSLSSVSPRNFPREATCLVGSFILATLSRRRPAHATLRQVLVCCRTAPPLQASSLECRQPAPRFRGHSTGRGATRCARAVFSLAGPQHFRSRAANASFVSAAADGLPRGRH